MSVQKPSGEREEAVRSRSVLRREAAMKGLPAPSFAARTPELPTYLELQRPKGTLAERQVAKSERAMEGLSRLNAGEASERVLAVLAAVSESRVVESKSSKGGR